MKSAVGYVVFALVLAGAGGVCWLAGGAEQRIAGTYADLLSLRLTAAAEPRAADGTVDYARHLPALGPMLERDREDGRAAAQYWLAQYAALERQPGAGTDDDRDAQTLLLVANAGFRAVQGETVDRATAVRHLNEVVKNYATLLKRTSGTPSHDDAAFNYEFAVHRRDEIARARGAAQVTIGIADAAPTIHGRPGAPPKGVSMAQFKVLVPRRSDERQESPDAGQGGTKKRKG